MSSVLASAVKIQRNSGPYTSRHSAGPMVPQMWHADVRHALLRVVRGRLTGKTHVNCTSLGPSGPLSEPTGNQPGTTLRTNREPARLCRAGSRLVPSGSRLVPGWFPVVSGKGPEGPNNVQFEYTERFLSTETPQQIFRIAVRTMSQPQSLKQSKH